LTAQNRKRGKRQRSWVGKPKKAEKRGTIEKLKRKEEQQGGEQKDNTKQKNSTNHN